jgi:hypothetical protein
LGHGRFRILHKVGDGQQIFGPGVVQLVGQLVGRVERVDGRHRAAHVRDGMEGDGVFGDVGAVNGQHIPLAKAALGQTGGHKMDAKGQLLVGDGTAGRPVNQGRLVAVGGHLLQ